MRPIQLILSAFGSYADREVIDFSHLEKETKRLDETHYQITLHYDKSDETEILIRILSFGAVVRVTAPESFREKIQHRLSMQSQY